MNYIETMFRTLLLLVIISNASIAQSHRLLNYFQESFDGPGIPAGWTMHQIAGSIASWSVVGTGTNPPIAPYGPPGQAKFNSYDAGPGEQARLISPAVDLTAAVDPFLEAFLYHDNLFPQALDSIYVEVTTGDSIAGPWSTLGGFWRFSNPARWGKIALSLLDYAGSDRLFVSVRGVSQYGNNMYLDEVRIADSAFHDLRSVEFLESISHPMYSPRESESGRFPSLPTSDQAGITVEQNGTTDLSVVIGNVGTFDEVSYALYWELDGEIQGLINIDDTLMRGSLDTIPLPLPQLPAGEYALAAWTDCPGDQNPSNDTIRTTLFYQDTSTLFFEGFNELIFPPLGWLSINRDGSVLQPWFWGSSTSAFPPFEGNGFAANNFQRANGSYLDDYLVSSAMPGVPGSGTEDSLVFWTRSAYNPPPFINYPDSLMVLLSTTGFDTTDFATIVDYFEVPKGFWARKAYRLTNAIPQSSNLLVAFRYLHYAGGIGGVNSDFVGIDGFHVKQSLPLSVKHNDPMVSRFELEANYPNPFNPQTNIAFSTPKWGHVSIKVFNILGEVVGLLADGNHEAGRHVVRFDGEGLSSGMYFYRLTTAEGSITRSMLLVR